MQPMFDYHTHTLISDGDLIPAEAVRRAEMSGYKILGIADHSDLATLPVQIPIIVAAARAENASANAMSVVPGTEITHVRTGQIAEAVRLARELGARYVIVHGETLVEPVEPGTNRAAIEAGVDILAHPGLISEDDVRLAAERNVMLEISGRKGHSLSNGHIARLALKHNAQMIFGSDAHTVGDHPTRPFAEKILLAAGIPPATVQSIFTHSLAFGEKRGAAGAR